MVRECSKCTNTASHVLNFCPQHLPPEENPAPAPPAGGSTWLDAPDGDGWWWATDAGQPSSVNLVRVELSGGTITLHNAYTYKIAGAERKYQPVKPHSAPPPPPLPTSKRVTLTARVKRCGGNREEWWYCTVSAAGMDCGGHGSDTKQGAVDACRKAYGIEPTVEGEQAP